MPVLTLTFAVYTCEQFQNEEAPHHLVEEGVPHAAAALVTAFPHVQRTVPPEYPGVHKVDEGDRQDHGRCGAVRERDNVDQAYGASLLPISDAMRPEVVHSIMCRLGLCKTRGKPLNILLTVCRMQ
jgi:hypothetical protein